MRGSNGRHKVKEYEEVNKGKGDEEERGKTTTNH